MLPEGLLDFGCLLLALLHEGHGSIAIFWWLLKPSPPHALDAHHPGDQVQSASLDEEASCMSLNVGGLLCFHLLPQALS